MVKKQRGKKVSSSKRTNTEKSKNSLHVLLTSSDDEAPEEVTFEDSKAQALRSIKQALDSVRREKELLKEKKRKRQELFQEQKKRKLLPADVLEKIDSTPLKKQKDSEEEAEEEEEEHSNDEEERKKDRKEKAKLIGGTYTVTTVQQCSSACSQQQAAEEFLRSRLYGPGSCRSTCNQLLSLHNKRSRVKGAAVQFVKKDWARQQKARAEKLKKRWIHRQQEPS
ncbi:unnamed protein product [Tetraodon nigroviridis]|uniref:Chromosome 15 SCAF14542, whole genome shotgun sequence n=1 Tax=Tetraodon nigroviridis TaxID=99883 RepID=Q4SNJ0_TETNG|nr:unnamed protein product [Tetraodon nigroviridis]